MNAINQKINRQYGRCSMYIIGDVHGCLDTLKKLLEQLPDWETKRVAFVGDLIDRGPKSRQVVDFVRDLVERGVADCVLGNHEQMMIDWTGRFSDMMWIGNGGQQCKDSYYEKPSPTDPRNDPESDEYKPGSYLKGDFNKEAFEDHKDWFRTLPVYMEYKDIKNEDGRHLVVSHSHVHNVWRRLHSTNLDDGMRKQIHKEITWGRPRQVQEEPDIYNVIGHTPQEEARIRSFYANIDTGCFYKHERHKGNYYHLTALEFPSMELYTQECIDEVDW
jgi:serine/threonine protein phosphatase 1